MDKRMPNFFIIGAAKAGTTSLYHYLKQHPEIYLSNTKEPHFFDDDMAYQKGLEWYVKKYFSEAGGYLVRGEATPAYLHNHKIVIPRILEVFQEEPPKLLVVLRDPVQRAWSHYLHRVRNGVEKEDFERALSLENRRLKKDPLKWCGYYKDGLYFEQLKCWFNYFPHNTICVVLNDDLRNKPDETLEKVFSFLGVSPISGINFRLERNMAAKPRSKTMMELLNRPLLIKKPLRKIISYEHRRAMKSFFRRVNLIPYSNRPSIDQGIADNLRQKYSNDITKLEGLINRDLSLWKSSR